MFAQLAQQLRLFATKGWSFLRPKSKLGVVSVILVASFVLVACFVFVSPTFADSILGDIGAGIRDFFTSIFFGLAGLLIKLTFFALRFVIEIGGYNGYIDSPAVTVGWVMVRDMTNMFFVIVLLIISFGTILGLEHYEYKKLLVKLIIAAIIVNFSRIICGVIIDIAQVVMITFVNGIAATASGNMVNMFNVDDVFRLGNGGDKSGLDGNGLFFASVIALVFGTMMLITMATFLLLLMARMAMLWVLIVLSPFAFVLNVLPQTEKYASQWWSQFGGHVVGGPVIAFFLWLSFVTVGSGAIHDDIKKYNSLSPDNLITSDPTDPQESTGVTNVMSYAKMANFFIAIAMLLAGAKMATELGMVGGDMMGKAKDIGKKVAMYASGFNAARWGAGKALQGGKFVAMKFPGIGGEAWIRRGKTIGGWAGTKFQRLQFWRNEKAKDAEQERKKLRDLEFKRKNNQISEADYQKEMEALATKKGGYDRIKGKKEEEAGKLDQALKDKKITEEQYKQKMAQLNSDYHGKMVSLANKGMLKRAAKGVFASLIETGGRKMDRADNWMEAYEEAKERTELEYSNSSFAGGQLKREQGELKEMSEETKKAKGERKRAEMRLGSLRTLEETAKTVVGKQAQNMLKAEMQVRDWKGQVEVAKVGAEHAVLGKEKKLERMYASEAAAKAAKEGHHADEEKKVMEEEIKQLNEAVAELENTPVGANGLTAGQIQKQIQAKRNQIGLLEAAKKNIGKNGDPNAAFKSKDILTLLRQIRDATKLEAGSKEQKQAMSDIQANGNYQMMFADQNIEEMIADERNLAALDNIEKAIEERGDMLEGKNMQDALSALSNETAAEVKDQVKSLDRVWTTAAHHSPSLYAARSSALRDNEYAFYRGEKQKVKDDAAQAEIWNKFGVQTPYGVSQQSVAEELYGKVFKDMNYNQTMAAFDAYAKYMEKQGEKATDRDRLISMGIMEKMLAERWVDDGTMYARAQQLGLQGSAVTGLKQRRAMHRGEAVRLNPDDITNLAEGFAGLEDFSHTTLDALKKRDPVAVGEFVKKHEARINSNQKAFMNKTAEELLHLIQNTADDQHRELLTALENKLKK